MTRFNTQSPAAWPWPFLHIAHRGLPEQAAENSLRGFAMAAALGAEMIETDLRLSADGALVLAHDDYLDLPRKTRANVARMPLAQLQQWRPGGEPLATLDEALGLRHHGAPLTFNLDIKVSGVAPALIAALRLARRREGVLLTGDAPSTFAAVRAELPWVQAALTREAGAANAPARSLAALSPWVGGGALGLSLVAAARLHRVSALTLEHTLATRETVRICHDAGLRVLVWTVDHVPLMRTMLAIGVDGITTNRVDTLLRLTGGGSVAQAKVGR
ncbi:MAG TPA: glycerophosphodiester phosphodiesterase family protein [Chloroflexota bacterium]|nr:glycerophosphodiester phosphodiesterase family protein [Chloroflexota bacterium]